MRLNFFFKVCGLFVQARTAGAVSGPILLAGKSEKGGPEDARRQGSDQNARLGLGK